MAGDHHSNLSGVVQGPAVQAAVVHGGIHLGPPRLPSPPAQLPPSPLQFVDRRVEQERLGAAVAGASWDRATVVVVSGLAGVGKTALVSHVLTRKRAHLPGGRLYVDVSAHSGSGALAADQALQQLLVGIGVAPECVPVGMDGRAALWRSHSAHRRLVAFADNITDATQVQPLVPGPGSVLVVAARERIALPALGVVLIDIPPMDARHIRHLLALFMPVTWLTTQPSATQTLAELCRGLPLAAVAVAGYLQTHPTRSPAHLVSRLRSAPADVIGPLAVAHADLPDAHRRFFSLLGVHPGPDISAEAAAVLAGVDDPWPHLNALTTAHLLDEHSSGRFSMHDLVSAQARDAAAQLPVEELRGAEDRLLTYYLRRTAAADLALNPWKWHLSPVFEQVREEELVFADDAAGLAWASSEVHVLARLVTLASTSGRHLMAWQICEAMASILTRHRHYAIWEQTHELGLASAKELGNLPATALMHQRLGAYHATQPSGAALARRHYDEALLLWEQLDHDLGRGTVHECIGTLHLHQRRYTEALQELALARACFTLAGRRRGVAIQDRHLATVHLALGAVGEAVRASGRALAVFKDLGDDYMTGRTLLLSAQIKLKQSAPAAARDLADEAAEIANRLDARLEQARVAELRADIARAESDPVGEAHHLRNALRLYADLGAAEEADAARARLKAMDRREV